MEETENFTGLNVSTSIAVYPEWIMGLLECCVFIFSFLFGLPLHSYAIWVIIRGTGVSSDFFKLNISACGILFTVSSLFILFGQFFPFPGVTILTQFFFGFAITGRPVFQSLMCIERYLAVVHPVIFLKTKPLRYRVICCLIAWPIILASCVAVSLFIVFLRLELLIGFILLKLVIFISIQIFCGVVILRALKQSGPGERRRDGDEENHMKRRAFNLILISVVTLIITYVPLSITLLLLIMEQINMKIIWSVSYLWFMLSGFLMTVLYLRRSEKLPSLCCTK